MERVTGVEGLTSCPLSELRSEVNPWLGEAMAAWGAAERGDLRSRHENPSAVLIAAIDVIRTGNVRRAEYEFDHPPPRRKPPPEETE